MWHRHERADAFCCAGPAGSRRRVPGHWRTRACCQCISRRRTAGPRVWRHGCDLRCRHGLGPDARQLPGLMVRVALDLSRQHPLLRRSGSGGAPARRRDQGSGGAAAGPCRRRVAYDVAWLGDRCASEARRLPRHESRLPGGERHGSDTFWLAPTAESASTARSPCIRNAGHGRSRRVADRHPVRLLGHAGLPAAVPEYRASNEHGVRRRGATCCDPAYAAGTTDWRAACDAAWMEAALHDCFWHHRRWRRIACDLGPL